jgi:hypothetical protein
MASLGLLGSPNEVPQSLRGEEFRWEFDTPLKAASEQQKVFTFQNVTDIAAKGAQIDPDIPLEVDWRKGFREAVTGAGGAELLVDEKVSDKLRAQKAEQKQALDTATAMAHGADVATRVSTAVQSAAQAGQAMQAAQ